MKPLNFRGHSEQDGIHLEEVKKQGADRHENQGGINGNFSIDREVNPGPPSPVLQCLAGEQLSLIHI